MLRAGSMIVELTLALTLLSAIGITVFKGTLDLMAPRQWTIYQNLSDSYITYEEAYAGRISFEELTANNSPWPVFPSRSTTEVEIGKMPGGTPITASVIRSRILLTPTASDATNPTEMESWQLQSHLTYTIGENKYVKSRTVVRSQ